jgi:hypothetical protein
MKIVFVVFENCKKVLRRKNPAANKRPNQENQFWSILLCAEQLPLFHSDKHKKAGINPAGYSSIININNYTKSFNYNYIIVSKVLKLYRDEF